MVADFAEGPINMLEHLLRIIAEHTEDDCLSTQVLFSFLSGSRRGLLLGRLTSRGLPTSSSKEREHGGAHPRQVIFTFMMVSLIMIVILMGHMYSILVPLVWEMLL